jgi:tyrosine-protein kinase Etk/Wzc
MDEGKTLVTTNLGVSFAELGLRTVILDADTRRGDVHHFLGGNRTPGLTDFLESSASGDDVIQSTSHAGLDFIGSGTRVSHSPELLSSRRMGDLLAALRKLYDVILVDSPPLGAGADPLVLGSITGHMLYVVRSGSTEKDFAMTKLEPLDRLPIRVMGVVLNDYVPDKLSAYRYYGSYLPGYEAGAEGESQSREERMIAGVGAPQS